MAHQLGGHKNHPMILMGTTLHHLIQQMYSAAKSKVQGRELYNMGRGFWVRKLGLQKVERQERDGKIIDYE